MCRIGAVSLKKPAADYFQGGNMFGFGTPQIIIILFIVLLIFGVGRLPEIGSSMGRAIKNFKKGIDGKDE